MFRFLSHFSASDLLLFLVNAVLNALPLMTICSFLFTSKAEPPHLLLCLIVDANSAALLKARRCHMVPFKTHGPVTSDITTTTPSPASTNTISPTGEKDPLCVPH